VYRVNDDARQEQADFDIISFGRACGQYRQAVRQKAIIRVNFARKKLKTGRYKADLHDDPIATRG
jgi:hypothetical protein